jgi:glycosyltransferase involved in cell wall biosynthesis
MGKKSDKKVSIVIPAHNEEKRIGRTLEEYGKFYKTKKKNGEIKDFEIIIVLNACKDDTLGEVKKFERKFKEFRHLNFKQGGKGFAIVEGFKTAKYELIGFVDADNATPPRAFYDLIKNINGYDGIIANRFLKESIMSPKQSLSRIIASRGFNFIMRALFNLKFKDTQCGAKLFKRGAIKSIIKNLGITKWAFDVDLLYQFKRKDYKIKECSTEWHDQKDSKLKLKKTIPEMGLSLIRLRLIYSPFKFIVRFYDELIPEKLKFHHRIK